MSQIYACPYPGCDQALLPGLLYLQQKKKNSKSDQPSEQKQELPDTVPVLGPSFTVLGLQQKHSQGHVTRNTALKTSRSHRSKRGAALQTHCDGVSSLPGLVSVGIAPQKRSNNSERGSTSAPNQLDHERVAPLHCDKSSVPARGKLTKVARIQNTLPPLDRQPVPSLSSDENVTETRLNHAEKIRAGLKAIERERLQKQRLRREERRKRHQESNNSPAFTGVFLGADRTERDQSVNVPVMRTQHMKLKSKERHQLTRGQSQLPTSLPDLIVGNRR